MLPFSLTLRTSANALYLNVNVFSTKVLIGTLFLRLLLETGPPFLRGHPSEPREGPGVCSAKAETSIFSYFKTLSIGPVPGIEPATSRAGPGCSKVG